jgi:molybdopterin-guanine dinucleotide biosynthesis protein A
VVLPVTRGFRQPLAAGYRTGLAGLVTKLVGEGNLRPGMLFEHCEVVVERPGGRRTVRAATVGQAAVAARLTLDRHVVALNGDKVSNDGRLPLVAGDTVAFLPADCPI